MQDKNNFADFEDDVYANILFMLTLIARVIAFPTVFLTPSLHFSLSSYQFEFESSRINQQSII